MNAAVLSRRDALTGKISDDTRTAFGVMWNLQMKTGPEAGAWTITTSKPAAASIQRVASRPGTHHQVGSP